jgi:hypothetical protein
MPDLVTDFGSDLVSFIKCSCCILNIVIIISVVIFLAMLHPQAADGGHGQQICRVAVGLLKQQLYRADQGLGKGLETPHHKNFTFGP